jgi:hypothetical protein
VIQFPGIVLSHPAIESTQTLLVNKNVHLLMDGLIMPDVSHFIAAHCFVRPKPAHEAPAAKERA